MIWDKREAGQLPCTSSEALPGMDRLHGLTLVDRRREYCMLPTGKRTIAKVGGVTASMSLRKPAKVSS